MRTEKRRQNFGNTGATKDGDCDCDQDRRGQSADQWKGKEEQGVKQWSASSVEAGSLARPRLFEDGRSRPADDPPPRLQQRLACRWSTSWATATAGLVLAHLLWWRWPTPLGSKPPRWCRRLGWRCCWRAGDQRGTEDNGR